MTEVMREVHSELVDEEVFMDGRPLEFLAACQTLTDLIVARTGEQVFSSSRPDYRTRSTWFTFFTRSTWPSGVRKFSA